MKTKSLLALCICIVMLCTLSMGGCSNKSKTKSSSANNSTADEATKSNAEISTEAPTYMIPSFEGGENSPTEAPDTSDKNDKNKKPNTSDKNQTNTPSNGSSDNTCTISLADGSKITAKKGDIITYTYYLKTPKAVECVQATLSYTKNYLQLVESDVKDMLPVISSGAIINTDNEGYIKYNAINLSGYKFQNEAVLITLRFEVMFGGSATITNAIEFMDEKGGAAYVDNYAFAKDVKYRETLALK